MERKLLSLPSFFVLLLIAGIAFLAAPVEDVYAQATATVTVTDPEDNAEADPVTSGSVEFTIAMSTAVKVTAPAPASPVVDAANGFGKEDLVVTIPGTTGPGSIQTLGTSGYTLAAVPRATSGEPDAANKHFKVTVAAPIGSKGEIVVALASDAAFEPADSTQAHVPDDTDTATAYYDTRPPTVAIGRFAEESGDVKNSPFRVVFTITSHEAFKTPPTLAATAIDIVGGAVEAGGVGIAEEDSDADPAKSAYTITAWVTPNAMKVTIGVKAGAVKDVRDRSNAAIATTLKTDGTPESGDALQITVDNILPDVMIGVPSEKQSGPFAVTFTVQETDKSGTTPKTTTLRTDELGTEDDANTLANASGDVEVKVTGGTIGDITAKPASFEAIFQAMVTPNTDADGNVNVSKVDIIVVKDALTDEAGNGNPEATASVTIDYTPPTTTDPSDATGTTGTALTGGARGFTFDFPAMAAPAATTTDSVDRFLVLAKAGTSPDNGVSFTNVINIRDEAWVDLADFLAYDGGTIDLIGPAGTAKNDVIISEIMWGRDDGLSDPTSSQWIELYNAKSIKAGGTSGSILAGEWTIRFHAGTGARTAAGTLSDNFSNRELGNAHWDIPNVSGGKYGQSGRTKITVGVAGALRDLVSMRRKIDYAKVEKTDHKTDAAENRTEQVKGIPDGALAGSWEASTSRVNMSGTRKGTPGARHVIVVGTSGISKSIVFNEIANRSDKKFDWIELYNPGSSDVQINNWVLSKVTGVDKDDKLFKFESDENIVVPAKGFLLVVNEDPSETALAAGKNVDNPDSNKNGYPTEVYIDSGLDIPKEKYLLVLRTEEKLKSHEKIVDIAGHLGDLQLVHTGNATELWPLKAWKRIKNDDLGENNDKTWVRDKGKDLYHGDAWKSDGGFTGLGIDRNPDSDEGPTSGTPGFDNGAVKDKVKDLTASNPVVISEIMFGTGNGRDPQWIELYNPSETQAVKLHNWRLEVQNTTIDQTEVLNVEYNYTLMLPDKRIQPNQTLLIVSASAREATRDRFPSDRVINVWSTRSLREKVEMTSARDAILSSVAFYIKLSDPEKKVVDEVGNIMRARDTRDWDLPGGNLADGGRASMLRRKGSFGDGTEADAWISAAVVDPGQKVGITELYYGNEDDVGTPGYRAGGPLPVQLSSFYSKRNDSGAVVITWSTESELDNAGFNILRSQSRTGEFVRINAQLIPGAGTTGEKTAYTWTDTGASPNVLYFYQIEDVSLAGDHRTLRTTRLRGYIGAAGKATTTWGDLKSRE